MCHLTAKRDTKGLLDGSSKSLGEAVFSCKFPAGRSNEASFLTPQSIDQEAEKHFRMWVKKDFSSKKPFRSYSLSHLAVAERLSVRPDERLATVNCLSALLIQFQAYIQHATAEQAKLLQSLREDPATLIPGFDENFSLSTVLDALEFAAFLTALISRISLPIQAEVRIDRRARLVNHLRPDQGNASKECDSPLKSFFPRTRALFLPVPSGETLRWMASHPKSAPTERSGHPAKVQDGYPSECNEHSRRGHQVGQRCVFRRGGGIGPLGGLLGSPECVFSRCHKSKRHKISPLRLQRGNFRISGPTFRALDRPQDVHLPGKGNRCLPEDVWCRVGANGT